MLAQIDCHNIYWYGCSVKVYRDDDIVGIFLKKCVATVDYVHMLQTIFHHLEKGLFFIPGLLMLSPAFFGYRATSLRPVIFSTRAWPL